MKCYSFNNATIRSNFYADPPATAILNCWFSEIRFRLSNTACLLVIIRNLFNCVESFPQILKAEKMELHQSLYLIKGSFSIGSITTSPRIDLTVLSLPLFVACTSHLLVTS